MLSKSFKMNKKNILITVFLAIIITLLPNIIANPEDYNGYCGNMMSGFYGSYGSGFMIVSWIILILIISLIIVGIYWLIKSANKK